MRDGVKLFTAVYVPKDTSQAWPILLQRTPYSVGPYGADNYPQRPASFETFAKEGFIFAHQDVRGRMHVGRHVRQRASLQPGEGVPPTWTSRSDAWDTIDWLVKNVPGNNGRVGMWGISYPGFYTAMAAIDAHPALKAASPQAPIGDWFIGDDWHHNGALFLAHAFDFFLSFGQPSNEPGRIPPQPVIRFDHGTPDGYDFFLSLGPLTNIDPSAVRDAGRLLARAAGARQLRRVLEGAQRAAPPEGHAPGAAVGRRLVRRRGPVRGRSPSTARRSSRARRRPTRW